MLTVAKRCLIRLALCCIILCPASLRAETHYKPHVTVGVHAGAGMSRMSFSPSVPQSWLFLPQAGIHARYAEEKIVGIMAELNFVGRGWKETFEDSPGLNYSRSLYYITLPVMTHINFGSPRAKCFFNLGPEIGFMLGNHISSNFDYINPGNLVPATRRVNQMSMDITNKFDYGITAGAGGEFFLTPRQSLTIEARFYYGLGNIYPSSKADEFSASRSMTLSINAGYSFRVY